MKFLLFFIPLLVLLACTKEEKKNEYIIQSDDYVLVEFAAKLEEAEHEKISP
jgi:hypothetical protein